MSVFEGPVFGTTKFPPGQIIVKPYAKMIDSARIATCLQRHLEGDWGDIVDEDKEQNEIALETGAILMSAYAIDETRPVPEDMSENCIWIITDSERKQTAVMTVEEYALEIEKMLDEDKRYAR